MFKKAFTLIELLVVVAVIAILTVILVPVVTSAIEETERTVCSNNLKVIGKAYYDYAQANESDPFPRHVDAATAAANPHAVLATNAGSNTLASIDENAMNTVWVLIQQGLLPIKAFKCPGDDKYTERTITTKYGWGNSTEFSYGVHYPYTGDGTSVSEADPNATYAIDTVAPVDPPGKKGDAIYLANWILMADRNPGGAVNDTAGTELEHSNHEGGKGGCSVVTKIGNVSFYQQEASSMAGFGDDIYIDESSNAAPIPESRSDTVISPANSR